MKRNVRSFDVWQPAWALLTLLAVTACGGADDNLEHVADQTPGIHRGDANIVFRTEKFTLEPGKERFVCYTKTLEDDLVVSGYSQEAKPFVHHVVFAKTTGDEPEGTSECDVLFRFAWEPMYLAGAGASNIDFPDGVGQVLPAGTRLLAQLHLLNTSDEPVTDFAELHMRPSIETNVRPIATYALGNFEVNLPPRQRSALESVCTVRDPVNLIAAFPHMHMLGTSLTFEVGPSPDRLTKVFERNPYSFDDQRLELVNLALNPGDVTRVTCNYDNTTDQTITFGESTLNEMCFLVGFATDRSSPGGCIAGPSGALGGS
jgi:hypothetical protein